MYLKSRHIFESIVASAISQCLPLVILVISSHQNLNKEQFGNFWYGYNSAIAIGLFAALGIWATSLKSVSNPSSTQTDEAAINVLTLVLALVSFLLAVCSSYIFAKWSLAPSLVVGLIAAFVVLNMHLSGLLQGRGKTKELAISSLCAAIFTVALLPIMLQRWGYISGLGVVALSSVILALLMRWFIDRKFLVSFHKPNRLHLKSLFGNSLNNLTLWSSMWLTLNMVHILVGPEHVGTYAAALTLRMLILFIPFVIVNVHWPKINNLINQNESEAAVSMYQVVLRWNTAILIVFSIIFIASTGFISSMLSASSETSVALKIIAIAAFFEGLVYSHGVWLQCQKDLVRQFVFISVPRDISRVLLAILLVPDWNALGACTAGAIAWGICWMLCVYHSKVSIKCAQS